MFSLVLGEGLRAVLDEFEQIFRRDFKVPGFGHEGIYAFRKDFEPFFPGQRRAAIGNVGPRSMAFEDDTVAFQFEIGASDRIGIDQKLPGQDANGRHLRARHKPARRHQVFHLVDDLQVDRNAIVRRDVEIHRRPPQ